MFKRRAFIRFSLGLGCLGFVKPGFSTQESLNLPKYAVVNNKLIKNNKVINLSNSPNFHIEKVNGEPTRFFYGKGKRWLTDDCSVLGITTYSEYLQVVGLSREYSRMISYAVMRRPSGNVEVLTESGSIATTGCADSLFRLAMQHFERPCVVWLLS